MAIFFIAAIGLLLLFLFLRRLSEANTHVLSDILKWVSATLLLIAFILFILSGRIAQATLLLIAIGLFFFSYRRNWVKKTPSKFKKNSRPLTLQEALAVLGLKKSEGLSVEDVEAAYQQKIRKMYHVQKQRKITQARDLLIAFVQKKPTSFSDFL